MNLTKKFLIENGYILSVDKVGNVIMKKDDEKITLYEFLEPSWFVQLDDFQIPLIHQNSIVSTLEELNKAKANR